MESQSWHIEREGRAWKREAMSRFQMAPEKIEMIHGRLFANQEERLAMLALLLENVGTDEAVRLGDPAIWRSAVAALDRPGGAGADRRAFAPVLTDDDRLRSEETLLASLRVRHVTLRRGTTAPHHHAPAGATERRRR